MKTIDDIVKETVAEFNQSSEYGIPTRSGRLLLTSLLIDRLKQREEIIEDIEKISKEVDEKYEFKFPSHEEFSEWKKKNLQIPFECPSKNKSCRGIPAADQTYDWLKNLWSKSSK